MRRLVLFVVLAFAGPAWAGSESTLAGSEGAAAAAPAAEPAASEPAPEPAASEPARRPAGSSWSAAPLTENPQAKPEWKGPSGFWTNPYPAKGGAYRWRMMAIGGVLLVIMGWFMIRLVKKANAERAARK